MGAALSVKGERLTHEFVDGHACHLAFALRRALALYRRAPDGSQKMRALLPLVAVVVRDRQRKEGCLLEKRCQSDNVVDLTGQLSNFSPEVEYPGDDLNQG